MTSLNDNQPYILVADDDPLMIRSLRIILRNVDLRVVGVSDGAAALQQIRSHKPAIAILDVMMARMNGLDLCRVIKSDETLRDVKVFLLTARAMPSERQQGMEAGADAYITKPFANADLVAQVREALGKREPGSRPPPIVLRELRSPEIVTPCVRDSDPRRRAWFRRPAGPKRRETVFAEDLVLQPASPISNDAGARLDPKPRAHAAGLGTEPDPSGLVRRPTLPRNHPGRARASIQILPGAPCRARRWRRTARLPALVRPRVPGALGPRPGVWSASSGLDLEIELEPGGPVPLERERYSADDRDRCPAQPRESRRESRGDRRLRTPHRRDGSTRRRRLRADGRPSLEGSDVDYVIVTSDALAPSWQALADWKTRRGVPTVVRTVEWIESNYRHGSDLQETIRTFVEMPMRSGRCDTCCSLGTPTSCRRATGTPLSAGR